MIYQIKSAPPFSCDFDKINICYTYTYMLYIYIYTCISIIMLNDAKLLLLFYLIYRLTSNMRWKWIETYPRKSSQRITVI